MILFKIPFATVIEWACLLTSITLLLNKPTQKYWVWFVPFLALTVAVETYSYFLVQTSTVPVDVQWIYNQFLIVYTLFHLYIFSKIINLPITKAIVVTMALVSLGIYCWEWSDIGFSVFFSITNTFFGGCIISLSLLYYYSLFKSEENYRLFEIPAFWFVTGCLIFYASTTGVNAFFNELITISKLYHFPIRFVIMNLLNIIMYSCWIKAFLCLVKNRAYFRPSY